MFNMEEPKKGQVYRHFKGKDRIYEVVAVARNCDNPREKCVVYKMLYDSDEFLRGTIFSRSLEDFLGFKQINGEGVKRFTRVK